MVEIYRNFDLTYASVDLQGDSVKAARRGHITRCSGVTSQKQSSAILFSVTLLPSAGHGLLILEVSRSHTTTHQSRQDSSGRVIS